MLSVYSQPVDETKASRCTLFLLRPRAALCRNSQLWISNHTASRVGKKRAGLDELAVLASVNLGR